MQDAGISEATGDPESPPSLYSLQLRITAEDPGKNWSLSVGKIQSFHFPSGNGIRVDTHLVNGTAAVITADFDSLIAKLIVTASTWSAVLQKAKRALADTRVVGVQTNISALKAIIAHPDFAAGRCDTQWLERTQDVLMNSREATASSQGFGQKLFTSSSVSPSVNSLSSSSTLFRKDDAWSISLSPKGGTSEPQAHHLQLTKVLRNDFPTSFSADILFTIPLSEPAAFTMRLESTSASASALSSTHRQGSPNDPSHVIVPFSGKLIEVLVDIGDTVNANAVICIVRQMKMELEVRTSKAGKITWITEIDDGEDVAEGMLAAVVEEEHNIRRDTKL